MENNLTADSLGNVLDNPSRLNNLEITLDPYEIPKLPETNSSNSRRKNGGRQNYTKNETTKFDNLFKAKSFTKFFTITADSGRNMAEIDVIKANEELEKALSGSPNRINETKNGHLLIETRNEEQSKAITNIKTLAGCKVTVAPYVHLNQTKGTIWYENKPKYSEEKLLETMKKYKVTEIYQIKKKMNNTLISTPVYILTFNSCDMPEYINIGWSRCNVRTYIPRPRRCFKCQKFGHGSKTCRDQMNTCANCGKI